MNTRLRSGQSKVVLSPGLNCGAKRSGLALNFGIRSGMDFARLMRRFPVVGATVADTLMVVT
jgi:hypothetical protein